MPDVQEFDLIVIGAGPAGCAAANTAALLGKKVAVVEKNPAVGGAAINTGTIPSKTLRETALALAGLKARAQGLARDRSEEHTSELQSQSNLVCRLLLEKKKRINEQKNQDYNQY